MAIAEGDLQTDPIAPADEEMGWNAVVDAKGVLLGFDESGKGDGIPVPVDCDLEPGKYRWVADHQRWDPIMAAHPKPIPAGPPDQLIAIALGFRAIGRTVALPAMTLEWLKGFERYPDDWTR